MRSVCPDTRLTGVQPTECYSEGQEAPYLQTTLVSSVQVLFTTSESTAQFFPSLCGNWSWMISELRPTPAGLSCLWLDLGKFTLQQHQPTWATFDRYVDKCWSQTWSLICLFVNAFTHCYHYCKPASWDGKAWSPLKNEMRNILTLCHHVI